MKRYQFFASATAMRVFHEADKIVELAEQIGRGGPTAYVCDARQDRRIPLEEAQQIVNRLIPRW